MPELSVALIIITLIICGTVLLYQKASYDEAAAKSRRLREGGY